MRDMLSRPDRPHLRGWLHAATFPAAVGFGIVLMFLARDTSTRIAVAIFAGSAALLFAVSATFHRGNWGPRAHAVLRRLDHASAERRCDLGTVGVVKPHDCAHCRCAHVDGPEYVGRIHREFFDGTGDGLNRSRHRGNAHGGRKAQPPSIREFRAGKVGMPPGHQRGCQRAADPDEHGRCAARGQRDGVRPPAQAVLGDSKTLARDHSLTVE